MNNFFDDFDEVFKCSYCNCLLESPVILPCSETICERHVNEIVTNGIIPGDNTIRSIKCNSCNDDHPIIKHGFPRDKRVAKLLARGFHRMNFGETHSKATNSCKLLTETIDKLKKLTDDPNGFITEYFNNLNNQIDHHKEVTMNQIETFYINLLDEIRKYKEEFTIDHKRDFKGDFKEDFKVNYDLMEEMKRNLVLWQEKLTIPDLSQSDFTFENIEQNINKSIQVLNERIEDFKLEILNGKEYKFDTKRIISAKDFGLIKAEPKV